MPIIDSNNRNNTRLTEMPEVYRSDPTLAYNNNNTQFTEMSK